METKERSYLLDRVRALETENSNLRADLALLRGWVEGSYRRDVGGPRYPAERGAPA